MTPPPAPAAPPAAPAARFFGGLLGWVDRRSAWLNRRRAVGWFERTAKRVLGYPLLVGQIALYLGIAWGVVGGEFGLNDLFWHDHRLSQVVVGFTTCWLFGVVVVVNTLLHTPRRLPGLPTSPDDRLARHEFLSLFPSRNPGVRRVGNRVLAWLVALFLLLYLVKVAILGGFGTLFGAENPSGEGFGTRRADAPAPARFEPRDEDDFATNWREFPHRGAYVALGYGLGLLAAYGVSYLDHRARLRERIAALTGPWRVLPAAPAAAGPCARDVVLGRDRAREVPLPVPATVDAWEGAAGEPARRRNLDLDAEACRLERAVAGPTPPAGLTAADVARVRGWAEEARANNFETIKLLHAMAVVVGAGGFAVLAGLFLAAELWTWFGYDHAPRAVWDVVGHTLFTPAVFLALFLIAADVLGGALAFRVGPLRAAAAVVLLWLLAVNSGTVQNALRLNYSFEHLPAGTRPLSEDGLKDTDPARYRKYVGQRRKDPGFSFYHAEYGGTQPTDGGPYLIRATTLLDTFEKKRGAAGQKRQPRLVLVATSGGAMRSAVWTALVLEGLEREFPGDPATGRGAFRDHIRVIAGASGGMVGAAAYAADFETGPLPQAGWDAGTGLLPFSAALAEESLRPVIQTALLHDFTFHAALPLPAVTDRGRVLETAWDRNFVETKRRAGAAGGRWAAAGGSPFARPVRGLAELEARCERPSLVFSPMMVEDSKRLLVSNLDLSGLTRPDAVRLDRSEKRSRVDTPAVELFRVFPGAKEFRVGTAARMSATFPILSPAVGLPTDPVRRLVDAGYYDNYGLGVLAQWLVQHKAAVEKHTSGVLVVQVRAFPMDRDNDRFAPVGGSPADALAGAVSAPLQAVLTASTGAGYHRDNELVDALDATFNGRGGPGHRPKDFFATAVFELDARAAMSWNLTAAQKKRVAGSWYQYDPSVPEWGPLTGGGVPLARDRVREQLGRIRAWFGPDGCGP